jgi:hypothetical protein
VQSLKREYFKVFENGIEQQIEFFSSVDEAFTVVLPIDRAIGIAFD